MPQARRLQIHLLTTLLLSFVAAGLLWINLHTRMETLDVGDGKPILMTTSMVGWPAISYTSVEFEVVGLEGEPITNWHWKGFLLNIVVAVGVLMASGWAMERLFFATFSRSLRKLKLDATQ